MASTIAGPRARWVWAGVLAVAFLAGCVPAAPGVSNPLVETPSARSGPVTDPAMWRTVVVDDFDGSTLSGRWSAYSGTPSSDPWTRWDPSLATVSGGVLSLGAAPRGGEQWSTGGVSNWRTAQQYGRWTVRYRATTSSIQSYHFLLWPQADTWPPEVDFAESWDPARGRVDGFVHWRDGAGARQRVNASVAGDFTGWNTVSVEWTPTSLTYTLNGAVWARFTGAAVPHQPMWLALQTETQICDRARSDCSYDSRTASPRVEVDRVVIEAYAG